MGWIEISIEVPGEYTEPMSALFARYADGGVVVEQSGGYSPDEGETGPAPGSPVVVKAFLSNDKTLVFRKAQIDVGLRLFSHVKKLPSLKERLLDEDDWRKQRFDPIRVGRRLVVAPPTNAAMSGPEDLVIPVEPGLAFGTGHHPTTQMCLRILEDSIKPGSNVLDVGCGSGILSIAALLLGASSALAIDIDTDAVKASASNAAYAGVVDRLTVLNVNLTHHTIQAGGFDLVIANISAAFLVESASQLLMCLKDNGTFVGSGYMTERSADVNAAFANIGDAFIESEQCEDWMAILVRRGLV